VVEQGYEPIEIDSEDVLGILLDLENLATADLLVAQDQTIPDVYMS
jgi:hypothetical protein